MVALRQAEADDGALVRLVRQGDREAFVGLMRRYNNRVFRIARSVLRDDGDAEDAAQDAWLIAYRHLHQLQDEATFSAWLARITAREALARARKQRLVLAPDVVEDAMDKRRDPERLTADREARAMLEEAIDALPEGFRVVFVLRVVEELSVAETAACLEIPEETVKTRLHRARRMLRDRLARRIDGATGEVFAFAGDRCDRLVARVLARLDG